MLGPLTGIICSSMGDCSMTEAAGYKEDQTLHLQELTDAGLARWARRESEPEFVFCFVESDMIQFEAFGTEDRRIDPAEPVQGITCKYRNFTFLWLKDLYGWDALLLLLRAAHVDDEAWIGNYVAAQRCAVEHLRRLAHATDHRDRKDIDGG